jgi:hypothetical protein
MNLNTGAGRAWASGQELLNEDQLQRTLNGSRKVWENDAYWMFMPFKLKDSGTVLKYRGEGKTNDGRDADIIRLMFMSVGGTSWITYDLWITRDDHLIAQWSYFPNAGSQEPEFTQPWTDWQKHSGILLSADRGQRNGMPARITDIAVLKSPPPMVFTNPAPLDWPTILEEYSVNSD